MDSILFFGDPHLDNRSPVSRLDDYGSTTINKLKAVLVLAKGHGIKHVITTGDMFHRYDVTLSYLNEVIKVLKDFKEAGIQVWSIVGNHDIPHNNMAYFKTTPLSLLFNSGLVKWLDNGNPILLKKSIINGLSFTQKPDRFNEFDKLFPDLKRILVMHYSTDNTVPGENIQAKELQMFDMVVAGHDHMYYEPQTFDGVLFYRPGSFTRRTKDEHNLTRSITLYKYTSS